MNTAAGLASPEACRRVAQFGPNAVPDTTPNPFRMALEKFWAPVPWMLEAAIALQLVLAIVDFRCDRHIGRSSSFRIRRGYGQGAGIQPTWDCIITNYLNQDRETSNIMVDQRTRSQWRGWLTAFQTPTIPLTWAEGRALLRSNSIAVPGAKTEWGGTTPPSANRDWQQSDKSKLPPGSISIRILDSRSRSRDCSALGIGLPFAQHVPDDRGQLSHHGHSDNGRSSSAFDAFEPLPKRSILPQHFVSHLGQQPSGHSAAGLSAASQPLIVLAVVATTGSEPPVIGQAV